MTTAYASTTTLAAIRAASPCEDGWRKLLGALGKTSADDEPLGQPSSQGDAARIDRKSVV